MLRKRSICSQPRLNLILSRKHLPAVVEDAVVDHWATQAIKSAMAGVDEIPFPRDRLGARHHMAAALSPSVRGGRGLEGASPGAGCP